MRLDGIQRASEQKPAKILALRRRKSAANPPKKKIVYEAGRLLGTLEIASEAAQREFIRNLPAEMLADRDDIGPTSTFEIERRDARIEEIEYAKRQLEKPETRSSRPPPRCGDVEIIVRRCGNSRSQTRVFILQPGDDAALGLDRFLPFLDRCLKLADRHIAAGPVASFPRNSSISRSSPVILIYVGATPRPSKS